MATPPQTRATGDARATRLAAVVRRTRRSLVATVLAAGLLLAVAIALAWVVGGVVLDLAMPLSVPGRQAVWCGWWAAVAAAVGVFLVAPASRWPLLDAVALRIERVIGDSHNQLLTVVDLARHGDTGAVLGRDGRVLRPDMVERLLEQTQERIRGFRTARVVPWRTLLRNLAIAAAVVGSIAALRAGLGDRFLTTLDRLLHPAADIPPATWLQLESPGDLDVLQGEPLEIRGRVVRGTVADATLVIVDAAGRPSRQPMRTDGGGGFVATLEGLDHDARYRLEAGNTWTKTHSLTILRRPEIRSLACRVRLPDYMRIDTPLAVAADARRIEPPEAATVEFDLATSPQAATGSLRLFGRSLVSDVVERFDDRIWFEDDLPRDAASDTPWKWTTTHASGGLRSFVCGTEAQPLAMRTRLDPLVLPRERPESRAFSLMARLDPADCPTRLTVLLEHGQSKTQLVWGEPPTAAAPAGTSRVVAGPLPRPGEWNRLSVPMKSLGQAAGQAVTAATFAVDRGRALFDRPGWVERSDETITRPVDTPIGEIPLAADAVDHQPQPREAGHAAGTADPATPAHDDRRWTVGLPVSAPTWVTAEFRSSQGHANLPMPPIEIAPRVDQPPSIVVDAMPETLVLKVADDVPISGRGFDDWGIDEVCVLAGPDPGRLAVRQTLPGASPALRPPVAQLSIATELSADVLGLAAGKSAVWKLRIRDTKGQVAETKLYRVTVLTPPESDLARTQVPALAQARREAEQLAREAAKKAEESDAKREAVRDAVAADEKPDKKLVEELAARLDRERRLADQLAKTLEKSAEQAATSDLVPKPQKEMLADLAAEARELERQLAGSPEQKPDARPEAKPLQQTKQQPEKPAEMQKPAGKSADADRDATGVDATAKSEQEPQPPTSPAKKTDATKAERVAESPPQRDVKEAAAKLADGLEDIERRLAAQGAALQIDALAKDLERRAEALATTPQTQAEPDQTRQRVREVEQILGRKIAPPADAAAKAADQNASQPGAASPPKPPTAAAEAGMSPPDTRKEASSPTPPAAMQATADAQAKSAATPDSDAAAKPGSATTAETPPPAAAAIPQPPATVTPPARAAADAAAEAAQSASRLAARLTGQPPTAAAPPAAAGPAADQPRDPRGEALDALLEGDDVREALAMAERARRLQAREAARAEAAARAAAANRRAGEDRTAAAPPQDRSSTTPARPDADAATTDGPSEGGAMAGRTAIDAADTVRGLDARQRAALYKLPPHIRDPLLEGMRQRGPAAYQGVIDTYFRQLGKDIPQ